MASRRATDAVLRTVIFPRLRSELGPAPSILNVGTLVGNTTGAMAREFFPHCTYCTLDRDPALHPDFCVDLQRRGGFATAVGPHDAIIVTSVFCLLPRPDIAIVNLLECVKTGGHCVVELDAFNNRGGRFSTESYTRDLDQSRFVFPALFDTECFKRRLDAFCSVHGVDRSRLPLLKILSMQRDGRANAVVWSIAPVFTRKYLSAAYHFNDDPERRFGCSYLVDIVRAGDGPRRPGRLMTVAYRPPAAPARAVAQAAARARYFGTIAARRALAASMLAYKVISCRIVGDMRDSRFTRRVARMSRRNAPNGYLVRVDDFPRRDYPLEKFKVFHAIMRRHSIPYMLAVTPDEDFFSGGKKLDHDGHFSFIRSEKISFGVHGFTHRRGEMADLRNSGRLDAAVVDVLRRFSPFESMLPVFIPPFNELWFEDYCVLRKYFKVITGGPESIRTLGALPPFSIRGVRYLPSYWGCYGTARDILGFIGSIPRSFAMPLTLHWAWEADDNFGGLEDLAGRIAGSCVAWDTVIATPNLVQAYRANPPGDYPPAEEGN